MNVSKWNEPSKFLIWSMGHEFNSLVLAILQVSGRAPKEKQSIIDQIKNLEGQVS
jgi:alkyl hydroperoxide reductase subunit AhpF